MAIQTAFLRTRVARRILGLFVLCAMVPLVLLASISYVLVTRQLNNQSRERVQQASKIAGMGLLERLQFFEADLRIVASGLRARPGRVPEGSPQGSGSPFLGVALQGRDGRTDSLSGRLPEPPPLDAAEEQHLRMGQSLVSVQWPSGELSILMAQAVDAEDPDRGILWASLDPAHVSAGEDDAAVPPDMELCLFDHADRPLYCSELASRPLVEKVRSAVEGNGGEFEWRDNRGAFLAGFWQVFVTGSYAAPPWYMVLSQSKESILLPMASFKMVFVPAVLMALWVVLLLSNVQIRRSLNPIEKLQEGTRRVAQRDFDTPVVVESRDEFEDLAGSFNAMSQRLGRHFSALTAMNEIDRAILSALETDEIIKNLLFRTPAALGCDSVTVSLRVSPGNGDRWRRIAVIEGETVAQEVQVTPAQVRELRDHPDYLLLDGAEVPGYVASVPLAERTIRNYVVLPVSMKEDLAALVALGFADPAAVQEDDLLQARALADQVAVALSNARLLEELDQFNWGALAALAQTVDAKSPWTAGHSERVTRLSLAVGHEMGLPPEQIDILHRGGLLHDVGKVGVPASVLDKPGRLNDEEWVIMRSHVTVGARILSPIPAYADLIPIVLYHHERWDGSGYPEGLAAEDIPFLARLLAVPDVYDALTSDRPYRSAWPLARVMDYITDSSGTQFDPAVTDAFLAVMGRPEPLSRYATFPLIRSATE
ncbi:MAG: HD domain-containing protein [Gemmatimonadales bacterium]|nr:HD domain-containing protein [Gemmatimonadales bacterium]NIN10616.1 HD domain-containing protein [Gemmatimonadales bacterium]NIN49378.1 HD domain-containing protein [Gemmatimonadales bacterium]NIP06842.1 HD domain-containing protein [Gemmatimonadales bacterium]NIR01516.1 HD domain-containing protein [Gemmatimonadales bacterium]